MKCQAVQRQLESQVPPMVLIKAMVNPIRSNAGLSRATIQTVRENGTELMEAEGPMSDEPKMAKGG